MKPGEVIVVSTRKGGRFTGEGYSTVYIGRPSILGNPFNMKSESERSLVIAKYEAYMNVKSPVTKAARAAVRGLALRVAAGENLALQCWCAPKPCHGDVIKQLIENIIEGQPE